MQTDLTNYPRLTKNYKIIRKRSTTSDFTNILLNIIFRYFRREIIKLSIILSLLVSPFFHLWCLIFNPSFLPPSSSTFFPPCFFLISFHFPLIVFYSFCTPISLVDFFFFPRGFSAHPHRSLFIDVPSFLIPPTSLFFQFCFCPISFLLSLFFFLPFLSSFSSFNRFAIAINLSVSLVCSSDGNDTVAIDFAGSG